MANKLYSQKILSERQINLSPTDSKFPYAGLHAIMRHPSMQFGNMDIIDDINWLDVAQVTCYQAILHAICDGALVVTKTAVKTSALFNIIQYISERYAFSYLQPKSSPDYFSERLMNAARFVSKEYKNKRQIRPLIRVVIDNFLGKNSTHNNPPKRFIVRLIQAYDGPEDWFELEVEKSFLGLKKNYQLMMDDKIFQQVVEHHMNFGIFIANNERENTLLKQFKKDVFEAVHHDLARREPKNNNS